ncbi:chorismate mutase [Bacillus shivajii]|uniref:chorismate mutase n=1 Tax=Bacillus shivajii TaxID=1983719 RepID=UPI001CF94F43|nr:chorismate mutase [Bacillus shivajii]UCZ54781.1 chorismate mutase [Bacillus shivajii]
MIRGIRGATTVNKNDEEEILQATVELLKDITQKNAVQPEEISHIIITMTQDLNATFPAGATRMIEGFERVPVMCAQEIPVPNSLQKCIRVMCNVNTEKKQGEIQHIYLKEAVQLRPDLTLTNKSESR